MGKTRAEAARLLVAFCAAIHGNGFDWKKAYGEGFDVLCRYHRVSVIVSSESFPAEYIKHEQSNPGGRTSAI
jgi:hypothetical protein